MFLLSTIFRCGEHFSEMLEWAFLTRLPKVPFFFKILIVAGLHKSSPRPHITPIPTSRHATHVSLIHVPSPITFIYIVNHLHLCTAVVEGTAYTDGDGDRLDDGSRPPLRQRHNPPEWDRAKAGLHILFHHYTVPHTAQHLQIGRASCRERV